MTNSDQLMLAAVKAQVPFKINDREVTVDGDKTTVSLFGVPVASISTLGRQMTLYGQTPVSRKSARVLNTLMENLTDSRIKSYDGQWILCGQVGEKLPIRDIVTIPMRE